MNLHSLTRFLAATLARPTPDRPRAKSPWNLKACQCCSGPCFPVWGETLCTAGLRLNRNRG